jgi:diguanylate cyclase (GGDEF)-like protein/PAS domain S-box-containing protein
MKLSLAKRLVISSFVGGLIGYLIINPGLNFLDDYLLPLDQTGVESILSSFSTSHIEVTFFFIIVGIIVGFFLGMHKYKINLLTENTKLNQIELNKNEQTLLRRSKQLQSLMDITPDSIFIKNKKLEFTLNNKAHLKILGASDQKDTIGKTDFDFFPKEVLEKERIYLDEQKIIETGKPLIKREREIFLKSEKRKIWVEDSKVPLKDPEGNVIGIIGIARDISIRKKAEQKILHLSFHDTLTGLYNRDYLEQEMQRLDTKRQLPISIIMADCNHLKKINDTYGHKVGDDLLKKTAEVLRISCRMEDIIARYAGDEFVIFMPQLEEEKSKLVCERIFDNCKGIFIKDIPLSLALGASTKNNSNQELQQVLKEADDNMYKCKHSQKANFEKELDKGSQ